MKKIFKFLFVLVIFLNIPNSFSAPTDCKQTANDGTVDCIPAIDRWVGIYSNVAASFEDVLASTVQIGCNSFSGYVCVNKDFTGDWDGRTCSGSSCPEISNLNSNNLSGRTLFAYHPNTPPTPGSTYGVGGGTATHQFSCPDGYTLINPVSGYGVALCKPPTGNNDLGCPDGSCGKNVIQGKIKAGDPIDAGSGNKYEIENDYLYRSSYPLTFTRYYNHKIPMWNHEYNRTISYIQTSIGEFLSLGRPSGDSWTFKKVSSNWVATNNNNTFEINVINPAKIEIKNDSNEIETYESITSISTLSNQSKFRLTKITKLGGGVLVLSYNTKGYLSSVTDPFGNVLSFTVSDSLSGCNNLPVITAITGPNGVTTSYQYNTSCQITKVTYPDTSFKQYTYSSGFLDQVKDELGNVIQKNTYTYSSYRGGYVNSSNGKGLTGSIDKISFGYPSTTSSTVTDARNNTTTISMIKDNGLTKATGFNGICTFCNGLQGSSITYNSNGFIDTITDFKTNNTKYTWDTSRNLPLSITEAYGQTNARKTSMTWNSSWRLPATITAPVSGGNKVTTLTYNSVGNIAQQDVTAPLNDSSGLNQTRTWLYSYDSLGQLTEIKNPRYSTSVNDKITIAYQNGLISSITNGLNQTTSYSDFNEYGQPKTITLPDSTKLNFTYDARGRVLTVTRKNSSLTQSYSMTISYNLAGLATQLTYPAGNYKKVYYDVTQRLSYIEEYNENNVYLGKVVYTLDDMSNITKVQVLNANGTEIRVKDSQYDSKNRLYKDIGSLNQTNTLTYDANSNLQQITDANNKNLILSYDSLNRLTSQTNEDTGVINITYNPDDTVSAIQDPKGLSTQYSYNGFGEVIKTISPDSGTSLIERDLSGNITKMTDAKNQVKNYIYDDINRITSITYPQDTTKNMSFSYDCTSNSIGKLCQMQDFSGTTSYSYDSFGRISSKTFTSGSFSKSVGYAYDAYGRINKITYPSGLEVNYSYLNNKINNLIYSVGGTTNNLVTNVTYEPFNPSLSSYTLSNSTVYQRAFSKDGVITSVGTTPSIYPINKTISYDTRFNIQNINDSNSTKSSSATYDDASRLLTYNFGSTDSYAYSYNTTGDRLTKSYNSTSEIYNYPTTNHKLSSIGSKSFGYDSNGSITSENSKNWVYDVTGRMSSYTDASNNVTYKFNSLGERMYKNINSSDITWFIYDENGKIIAEYDGSNNLKIEYIYLNGQVIAIKVPSGSSYQIYHVFNDHLGTPRAITDTSNNLQWQWENIEPFGDNQPIKVNSSFIDFNFRLPGQYFDKESRLNYNYFRDYNSSIGRYMQSDPIGLSGGINPYGYVEANSLGLLDDEGLLPSLPQGLVNYVAGYGDSASLGISKLIRTAFNIDEVDYCNPLYLEGERADLIINSVSLGVSYSLRNSIKNLTKAQKTKTRADGALLPSYQNLVEPGYNVHHVSPLFGHPPMKGRSTNIPALFPTGGLPPTIHSASSNLKKVPNSEHTKIHIDRVKKENLIQINHSPAITALKFENVILNNCNCNR